MIIRGALKKLLQVFLSGAVGGLYLDCHCYPTSEIYLRPNIAIDAQNADTDLIPVFLTTVVISTNSVATAQEKIFCNDLWNALFRTELGDCKH